MSSSIIVFASGTPTGGGSGFRELREHSCLSGSFLDAHIAAVVSQYPEGGVNKLAKKLNVRFHLFQGPFDADHYREIVRQYRADFVALSGWVLKTAGLDPRKTVNIHPGPLEGRGRSGPFGGKGKYGHHVHEAVMEAYHRGEIAESAVTMHFVTDDYDAGPIITKWPVLIRPDDTPETLAARVNEKERAIQSWVMNLVIRGHVKLIRQEDRWVISASDEIKKILPGIEVGSI
ncbi:MAG: formyltransferase family protein [Patescibacteria group bacterium]|nr:formyltransferase family protein [Patescibacteria group bacterium]